MATPTDYKRLRNDIGADQDALSNGEAEEIFVEAAETYTSAAAIKAATRVIALGRLLAQAATRTDYAQDTTQEKQGQIFDHYKALLPIWQANLDAAYAIETRSQGGAARFGGLRIRPARVKEFPNA